MHARPTDPTTTPVSFLDLEALESLLVDGYESAVGLSDAGHAQWEDIGQPIAKALMIVKRILAEGAA